MWLSYRDQKPFLYKAVSVPVSAMMFYQGGLWRQSWGNAVFGFNALASVFSSGSCHLLTTSIFLWGLQISVHQNSCCSLVFTLANWQIVLTFSSDWKCELIESLVYVFYLYPVYPQKFKSPSNIDLINVQLYDQEMKVLVFNKCYSHF